MEDIENFHNPFESAFQILLAKSPDEDPEQIRRGLEKAALSYDGEMTIPKLLCLYNIGQIIQAK